MRILKGLAMFAVVLLAALGCLFVLDLVPREQLQDLTVKTFAVFGILGAATLTIAYLFRGPDR